MQRKIFIGVDLPTEVKKRLMQKIERWRELPIRWSREDNLHLTLVFLGFVDDEMIVDICNKIKNAIKKIEMFDIKLTDIGLGPNQDENAKLVWFIGSADDKLKRLVENIEKELGIFKESKKVFRPHITLGRIQKYNWQKMKKKPKISEKFSVLLPIDSVQIFESAVIDGKRKFDVIDSGSLKDFV